MFARRLHSLVVAAALASTAIGCTSGHSAARPYGGARLPRHLGEVAIYGITAPSGSRLVGDVFVEGAGDEANVEILIPELKSRVADLGATGAVIDRVETDFRWVTETRTVTYTYPCGYHRVCTGVRFEPYQRELRVLRLFGRAVLPEPDPRPADPPGPASSAGVRE